MPQAGTFGINFDEIMMIATAITFLFAIIPVMTDSHGINPFNVPGAFYNSFNTLWFNDFDFFRSSSVGGCIGAINSSATANIGPVLDVYNNTVYEANRSLLDEYLYKANLYLGLWARGTPTVSNTPIRTGVDIFQSDNPVGAFISTITNLIGLVFKIVFDCSLGAFRLLIGLSIATYWFLKLIPLWQLLWSMFMAFIG